jgi:hypothetical protein
MTPQEIAYHLGEASNHMRLATEGMIKSGDQRFADIANLRQFLNSSRINLSARTGCHCRTPASAKRFSQMRDTRTKNRADRRVAHRALRLAIPVAPASSGQDCVCGRS